MRKVILAIVAILICMTPFYVSAADFNGSKPLICVLTEALECTPGNSCLEVTNEDINLPNILKVDVENNSIRAVAKGEGKHVTKIENKEHIDGKLILQGAEDGFENYQDGLGWTMAIKESDGDMILTASGENVAFVVYGECVPTIYLK